MNRQVIKHSGVKMSNTHPKVESQTYALIMSNCIPKVQTRNNKDYAPKGAHIIELHRYKGELMAGDYPPALFAGSSLIEWGL